MDFYLGIDGGASTIRVALIDEKEKIIQHFKLYRNSNPTSTGFVYLKETLYLIRQRIEDYTTSITCIVINLAGVGAQQQKVRAKQIVQEVFFNTKQILVYHDAHGSLLANSPDEASILVICGTGSVLLGKDENEQFYRAGGWGYLLGDEASGFWLVKNLFQEYLAFQDGIREDDNAFDVFRDKFEIEPRDALYRFYESECRRETASLSSLFLDREYLLAQSLVTEGIKVIKKTIESLKERIKDDLQSIIYMGGMFESPFFLREFQRINGEKPRLKQGKKNIEIELATFGKEKDGRD